MQVFHSATEYARAHTGRSAVALGFFDGVHIGHRSVIDRCTAPGCDRVVLTFSHSPASILSSEPPVLLSANEEKARLIADLGADALIFADFRALMHLSPAAFAEQVLADQLHARLVCCGYNYRFGSNGSGSVETLRTLGERMGFEVRVCDPVEFEGEGVSSTRIRTCIISGEIERANIMLARAYSICGTVAQGNRIGSDLGFPTVNLPLPDDLVIPRFGVYASTVEIDGVAYAGVTNIGVHPTVGATERPLCETFILNYHGELYGREIACRLHRFIRPEQHFASAEELRAQVARDIAAAGNCPS